MAKMTQINIPFNKPFLTGFEKKYIERAVNSGKISGNGVYTQKCQEFFKKRYGFKKTLLTNSCTDALEMCAILLNIQDGDEVIMPSFTFVSTANAFILRGAKIVFADSCNNNPNIDCNRVEELITSKTKAIVVVHYAGIACDMAKLTDIAKKHNIYLVEDAAHAIDSFYSDKALGSVGDLATFSFHETKNIISGEGGMLVINNEKFADRSEIIWEKGTNRSAFFRGEVDKYGWVDIGSSFLPSEITAAFLFAQLEFMEKIQKRRVEIWETYNSLLIELEKNGNIILPKMPEYASKNGHMFYFLCESQNIREKLIEFLKGKGALTVFHYLPLHCSPFYKNKHDGRLLPMSVYFSEHLLRLPLFFELTNDQLNYIVQLIFKFYKN